MININPDHYSRSTWLPGFQQFSGNFPPKRSCTSKTLQHHPRGAPVFTRQGLYTTRGWTEWTQGFQ